MDRLTVTFRGKIGNDGEVKVPKLTGSHLSTPDRGMYATLFTSCREESITGVRLRNMYRAAIGDDQAYWPNYVSENTPGFTFEPQSNGFMASCSIQLDLKAMRGAR